jgi:hypothetical protein
MSWAIGQIIRQSWLPKGLGLGALLWTGFSVPGWAQSPQVPFALVGERAALQDAICQQDWGQALVVTDRLLALDALPASYRDEMVTFRTRLLQYQEAEVVLPAIAGCDNLADEIPGDGSVFSERISDLATSMTSPLTQRIVRNLGSDNLLMARGLCSVLEADEVENPFGLMVATVERNFFGVPMLDMRELRHFQRGDRDQQQALVEYLSFISFVGAMQFCQNNIPVVEEIFNVEIPEGDSIQTAPLEE